MFCVQVDIKPIAPAEQEPFCVQKPEPFALAVKVKEPLCVQVDNASFALAVKVKEPLYVWDQGVLFRKQMLCAQSARKQRKIVLATSADKSARTQLKILPATFADKDCGDPSAKDKLVMYDDAG